MTWQPTMITTIDGRQVLSDSEDWRVCCEAVYTLSKPEGPARDAWLNDVAKKRGAAGRQALEEEMARVEPAFLLFKSEAERLDWLSSVEWRRGISERERMEREMHRIEPAYLLAMETKEQRLAYLVQVERCRGEHVRKDLERRLIALWEQRKAAQAAAS